MPHIIVRGIKEAEVKEISESLIEPFSKAVGCAIDHITLEYLETIFYTKGIKGEGGYPFVSIQWFKRTPEACEKVARLFNEFFVEKGYLENAVIFTDLEPKYYFENGEHF